jgi:mannose-6-phosphate isomerase-like protein (cupin superfamily)
MTRRCLVTGLDSAGKSAVITTLELAESTEGERPIQVWPIYKTAGPPAIRPPGRGETHDLGVRPGEVYWMISCWAPDSEGAGFHHTDTLDFDVVLAGSIAVILGDGTHTLETGDCIVITGVDHGWKAGPDGCTLAVALIGTPEPTAS